MLDPNILSTQHRRNAKNHLFHGNRDRNETPLDRYVKRVWRTSEDECWEWMGSCNSSGYGTLNWEGKTVMAHRVAAQLAGLVPTLHQPPDRDTPEFVKHTCKNRKCCNPKHLVVGAFGQRWAGRPKTSRHGNDRFTLDQVTEIRRLLASGVLQKIIAIDFNCSPQSISLIHRNKSYRIDPAARKSAWPTYRKEHERSNF
jgi:hypothetical protein